MENAILAEPTLIPLVGLGFLILLIFASLIAVVLYLVFRKSRETPSPSLRVPPVVPSTQVIPRKCPQCGATLKADVPEGLCPACLLQRGIATEGGAPPGTPPFTPPPMLELAKLFPQLEILELIGQGGMGAVYKARQPALDRLVALKILAPRSGGDLDFSGRFTREARALARLSHPNIVAVYDFGQIQRSRRREEAVGAPTQVNPPPNVGEREENVLSYFIMEYVDGPNLRQIEQSGKLTPREALQIIPQICAALQFAHDEGIVHRDIKPENVLLDKKGRVKIADFGLAKILGQEADFRLTGARDVMGTPHYMAPEQVEKPQEVDHRADIYSLGVVFYEMLTGELPLGKFDPPSHKVRIDVRLDNVVLRSLANNPDRRYQHVSEVKTEVESIAETPSAAAKSGAPVPASSPNQPLATGLGIAIGVFAAVVFIAFLGLLAGVAIPNFIRARHHAQALATQSTALRAQAQRNEGTAAIIHLRRFTAFSPNSPSLDYAATVPSGYELQATATPDGVAHCFQMPSPSGEYHVFWNFPYVAVHPLRPEDFKRGQRLPAPAPAKFDSVEQREAQRKVLEAQLQALQDQGPIPVVLGEPKVMFSVTNGSGEIWQGFLELIAAKTNAPAQTVSSVPPLLPALSVGLPPPRTLPSRQPHVGQLSVGAQSPSPEEQVQIIEQERRRFLDGRNSGAIAALPPGMPSTTIDPSTGLPLPAQKPGETPSLAAQPPVVVETFPVSGARDVAPGETEIRVRFSKTMENGSWSWSTAWENSTPESIGSPAYLEGGRTCIMKVRLEPGKTYGWWLNSDNFHNFTDSSGRPAIPYLLIFQTKPN